MKTATDIDQPVEKGVSSGLIDEATARGPRSDETQRDVSGRALPPRDRGVAAWTCLSAISAISMATWGNYSTSFPLPSHELQCLYLERFWCQPGSVQRILYQDAPV